MQTRRGVFLKKHVIKRVSIIFLITCIILIMLGGVFHFIRKYIITNTYKYFIYDVLTTSTLLIAGLVLCFYFIFLIGVIVLANPVNLKRIIVIRWAFVGVFVLILTGILFNYSISFVVDRALDIEDYENGDWKVEDLEVLHIYHGSYYRGRKRVSLILETKTGDLFLPRELAPVRVGKSYRFTYLERSGHILEMEEIPISTKESH